ncbi:MAG: hypothetical protein IT353_08605 [Gemmatimonadaceae bacterium]|nr:hypothetical protein [Gemmatimonadaceae bacterium]
MVLLPLTVLLVVLALIACGFRTILLTLLVQSAERGNIIPVSLTLARVPVPTNERFCLGVPARRQGEPLWALGTLVLTTGRVRLVRRGSVVVDIPLANVAHLTVQGFALAITVRGASAPTVLRVTQPAVVARYIQRLATMAVAPTVRR